MLGGHKWGLGSVLSSFLLSRPWSFPVVLLLAESGLAAVIHHAILDPHGCGGKMSGRVSI